jgi:hypothetical protein
MTGYTKLSGEYTRWFFATILLPEVAVFLQAMVLFELEATSVTLLRMGFGSVPYSLPHATRLSSFVIATVCDDLVAIAFAPPTILLQRTALS